MERRALSVAAVAAALALALLAPGAAVAVDPFEALGVLRPPKLEPAPDVPFTTLDGRGVTIRQFLGKPVLLGFFTTW